ncbi:MAG: A/G-specific adenine glycosylase [Treponema sp.]|nr:A/G-specific adenine glycosylase [Treponema sp.]
MDLRLDEFRRTVYQAYEEAGRTFPWRENTEPWGILVSELMLQQTQVSRVEGYWTRWMEKWPSPEALAKASLAEALREWSGLGYNRRCRFLKSCADVIYEDYRGIVPHDPHILINLPGIGPYTAGAVACFAYNYPSVFIETNIRSVFLHFYFPGREGVRDKEILPLIKATLDYTQPQMWYWALMDYGNSLKKIQNPERQSAHYSVQSKFKGSFREVRGSLIRAFNQTRGPLSPEELLNAMDMDPDREVFYRALESLRRDLLVAEEQGKYRIR